MGQLTEVHGRGLLSARPAAGHAGREYFATDTSITYRDNGSTWDTQSSAGVADQGVVTYFDFTVAAAPGTPASGKLRGYAKTGKVWAVKDDAGVETVMGAGGGTDVVGVSTGKGSINLDGLRAQAVRSGYTRHRFDDSALTGWTAHGSPTTVDADTTLPGHLYVKCTTTDAIQGESIAWTPGAGKFLIVKIAAYAATANFTSAGIFLRNASSGKAQFWGWRRNSGFDLEFRDFNGYVAAGNNGSVSPLDGIASSSLLAFGPLWLRIKYNSSTSYDLGVSRDGIKYLDQFSAHAPTYAFTPDQVGVGLTGQGATGETWIEYLDVQ